MEGNIAPVLAGAVITLIALVVGAAMFVVVGYALKVAGSLFRKE